MQVYEAVCTGGKFEGSPVALKHAHPNAVWALTKEVAAHQQVGYQPGCVPLIDFIEEHDGSAFTVLPLYNGGSLSQEADSRRRRPHNGGRPFGSFASLIRAFQQAAAGLSHMHAQKLVHGDVKEENILLQKDALRGVVAGAVIADYGLSVPEGTTIEGYQGTMPYIPPEILLQYMCDKERDETCRYQALPAHDVWSVAVAFFAAISRIPLWKSVGAKDAVQIEMWGETYADMDRYYEDHYRHLDLCRGTTLQLAGLHVHENDVLMWELLRILQRCLQDQPEERCTAHELQAELQTLLRRAEEEELVLASLSLCLCQAIHRCDAAVAATIGGGAGHLPAQLPLTPERGFGVQAALQAAQAAVEDEVLPELAYGMDSCEGPLTHTVSTIQFSKTKEGPRASSRRTRRLTWQGQAAEESASAAQGASITVPDASSDEGSECSLVRPASLPTRCCVFPCIGRPHHMRTKAFVRSACDRIPSVVPLRQQDSWR